MADRPGDNLSFMATPGRERPLLAPHEIDEDVFDTAIKAADAGLATPRITRSLVAEVRRLRGVVGEMQQAIDYAGDTVPEDEEAERRDMLGTYLRDHA